VPFAKERLAIGEGILGVLLLCLGIGSVGAMLLAGILGARYGTKPFIILGGLGLAVPLPLLSIASSPLTLGLSLFVFGASLGSVDVAMNIHAVEVERAAGRLEPPPIQWTPVVGSRSQEVFDGKTSATSVHGRIQAAGG
jgi:predicted MFS family arabinose efflux permease